MIRIFSILILICLSVSAIAQEKSLSDLYSQTLQVSELINQAEHLKALDNADIILAQYSDFTGNADYFTYLNVCKATAYLGLGLLDDQDFQASLDQRAMVLNNLAVCAIKLKNEIAADSFYYALICCNRIGFCCGHDRQACLQSGP